MLQALRCWSAHTQTIDFIEDRLDDDLKLSFEEHLKACPACNKRTHELLNHYQLLQLEGCEDLLRRRLKLESELKLGRRFLGRLVSISALALCLLYISMLPRIEWLTWPKPKVLLQRQQSLRDASPVYMALVAKPQPVTAKPVIEELKPEPELILPKPKAKPKPAPKKPAKAPVIKVAKPAPKKPIKKAPRPVKLVDMHPILFVAQAKPKAIDPNLPKAVQEALGRLGVDPGFRYGELTFYPVVDHSAGDQPKDRRGSRRIATMALGELEQARPSRVVLNSVKHRNTFPVLQGTLLPAPWGWRIARQTSMSFGERESHCVVFSLADPDLLLLNVLDKRVQFRKTLVTPCMLLPSQARLALALGADNGTVRELVWKFFLEEGDWPRNKLGRFKIHADTRSTSKMLRQLKLRFSSMETEMRELSRRLRKYFVATKGLRGLAASLGERVCSIDVFSSPDDTLAALDTLLISLAVEAFEYSLFHPLMGSVRPLMKNRREHQAIHQLLMRNLLLAKRQSPKVFTAVVNKKGLESGLRVELGADCKVKHAVLIKTRGLAMSGR